MVFALTCLAPSAVGATAAGRSSVHTLANAHGRAPGASVGASSAPMRVLIAAAASRKADRALVFSAEALRRCWRKNGGHPSRCERERSALQRAGATLASLERELSAAAQASCRCGRHRVATSATLRDARLALRLTVSGHTLRWVPLDRITSYILERKVPGQAAQYSVVRGTSVTPPPVPGVQASYSIRTTAYSSAWAQEEPITYPWRETADAQAAPAITVSGGTLSWNPIAKVKAYVLMTKVRGKAAQYSVVAATSVTLTGVADATVRTAVYGSAWAPIVDISYPVHSQPTTGPTPTTGTTGRASTEGPAPGSATPSLTGPAGPAGPSNPTSPAPEAGRAKSSLMVGVVGLVAGRPAQVATFQDTLHTRYMRLDAGNGATGWYASDMPAFITEVVTKYDVTPLILYNPDESQKETLVGRPVTTVRSEVKALGDVMHGLGLKWMEFGNEEYFYEQPGEYAKQYMAALEALSGLGITLIPNCWGDYWNTEKGAGNGYWSQVANGGGWWVDFVNDVKALGGGVPAAASLHPYGPMTGHEYFGAGGGPSGWMSVPAMHDWMVEKHMAAPIWITEVGSETYGTSNEIDTEQSFAARIKQYVEDSYHWSSYVQALFIYSIADGSEQGVGLFKTNGAPKLAATAFGETVASLGLASA
jgi:hypothetical protein